jgi:hypothetical protein
LKIAFAIREETYNRSGMYFYVTPGPYLAWGIKGNRITDVIGSSKDIDSTINWTFNESDNEAVIINDLKPVDYGVRIGIGFEVSMIQLNLMYGWGLANISTISSQGRKINNRFLAISLGIKLADLGTAEKKGKKK